MVADMVTPKPLSPSRQAIIVLGVHRSGTSALTGVLELSGCTTPAVQIAGGAQNPKGFFEARKVARLNDLILEIHDETWSSWQPLKKDKLTAAQKGEFQATAAAIVKEEFADKPLIALKDPRICKLVPFWLGALQATDYAPCIIHTHRNPVEVAQSLQKRNGFDPSLSLLLWLSDVLSAEAASRGHPRAFTSFDQLLTDPVAQMAGIEKQLEIRFPNSPETIADEVAGFLSGDMRHHNEHSVDELPTVIKTVFDILQRWAKDGEDQNDYSALDQIERLFSSLAREVPDSNVNATEACFRALFQVRNAGKNSDKGRSDMKNPKREELISLNQALTHANTALTTELEICAAQLKSKEADIANLSESNQTRDRELSVLTKLLLDAETASDALRTKLTETAHENDRLADENDQLSKQADEQHHKFKSNLHEMEEKTGLLTFEHDRLTVENLELHQLVARVEGERHAIASSRIWRATGPLRWILNRLRRSA